MAEGIDFGKPIGPLPLGAWIVVVGGGLGYGYYKRKTSPITAIAPQTATGSGTSQSGVGAGTFDPGPGFANAGSVTSVAPTTGPTTNEEWVIQGINYLIAQKYDPNLADQSLRDYIQGKQLTPAEYALIGIVLARFGSVPQPLPDAPPAPVVPPQAPPPVVPHPGPPAPTPAPPKPHGTALRYVIVLPWPSKLSTLTGIAQAYYGRKDEWHDIYNANKIGLTRPDGSHGFISNPNYLRPGDRLWVPGNGERRE